MSRHHSEEVILHEMSSYFSEEEWKLLHEWQKELYRNVMKEIHQALISLGPLIATTVCSLRAKEKEELCSMENQGSERNHGIDCSTSDAIANTDVLFKMHREENVCLNNPQETEERQVNDCLSAGEEEGFPFINTDICLRKEKKPASIFISHLGEEVGESSTGSKSEHEVISFRIKDEDETYCMVHQGKKRIESINSPTGLKGEESVQDDPITSGQVGFEHGIERLAGDGIMIRKSKLGDSENITGKTTPYNLSSGKDKVRVLHSPENDAQCTSQLWSDNTEELGGDETSQSESAFGNNTAYFSIYKETPKVQSSNKYNDWESNLSHANVVTCQPDLPQNWRLYSCIECEKSFHKKENLMKHKRIHMGVRPYQCTECGRSFIRKENLIVHKRTHTGERPYHCTTCDKSFSQKGVLSRHQRTHIGERPYYCTECEKSFSLKGNLIAHQKTHTQHRLSP